MQGLLQQGEKIAPKQWEVEIQSLQSEYDSISKEKLKIATELVYVEAISYKRRILRGSFRTRADSITNNRAEYNRGKKKFDRIISVTVVRLI